MKKSTMPERVDSISPTAERWVTGSGSKGRCFGHSLGSLISWGTAGL